MLLFSVCMEYFLFIPLVWVNFCLYTWSKFLVGSRQLDFSFNLPSQSISKNWGIQIMYIQGCFWYMRTSIVILLIVFWLFSLSLVPFSFIIYFYFSVSFLFLKRTVHCIFFLIYVYSLSVSFIISHVSMMVYFIPLLPDVGFLLAFILGPV